MFATFAEQPNTRLLTATTPIRDAKSASNLFTPHLNVPENVLAPEKIMTNSLRHVHTSNLQSKETKRTIWIHQEIQIR